MNALINASTHSAASSSVTDIDSIFSSLGSSLTDRNIQSHQNSPVLPLTEAEHNVNASSGHQVDISAAKEHSSEMLVDANTPDVASTHNISSNEAGPSHGIERKITSNRYLFEIFCS